MESMKRKRNVLTLREKLKVIEAVENEEKYNDIADRYKISKSTVSDIYKKKNYIINISKTLVGEESGPLRKTAKYAQHPDLEEAMYLWFKQCKSLNEPVNGPLLKEKAKVFAELLNYEDFRASDGWLRNFKNRHCIHSQFSISGEQLSTSTSNTNIFLEEFKKLIFKYNYTPDTVYNADETGLFYKCLPEKTLASESENVAREFEKQNERLTVMLCSNASGSHKLTPVVIGKYKSPKCLRNVEELPVTYQSQKNAWMDINNFMEWFQYFRNVVKEKHKDKKILLLIDNAPCHITINDLNSIDENFKVVFFHPNIVSLLQPMDQGIINKFKITYRKKFLEKFSIESNNENVENFLKNITLLDSFKLIKDAWELITAENIKASWKQLWPKISTEYLGDINNQIEQLVSDIISMMPPCLKVNPNDFTNWINCDSSDKGFIIFFDDNEIIHQVKNVSEIPLDESDIENSENDNEISDNDNEISENDDENSENDNENSENDDENSEYDDENSNNDNENSDSDSEISENDNDNSENDKKNSKNDKKNSKKNSENSECKLEYLESDNEDFENDSKNSESDSDDSEY